MLEVFSNKMGVPVPCVEQGAQTVCRPTCPFCNTMQTVIVPTEGLKAWLDGGAMIQRALPNATPSEREALMTGICDDCFPSDDEDDE